MAEVILNLLPLKSGERAAFEAAAPEAVHIYSRRSTVTPEQLAPRPWFCSTVSIRPTLT